jgi:hypothetical protein
MSSRLKERNRMIGLEGFSPNARIAQMILRGKSSTENENGQCFVPVVKATDLGSKVQLLCSDEHGLLSLYLDRKDFCDLTRIICQRGLELKGTLIRIQGQQVQIAVPRQTVSKLAFLHSIGLPHLPRGLFGKGAPTHANPGSGRQVIK